jgi:hypothetical protein
LRIHIAFLLLLTSFATGQTLTGTVKNSTTGKASAGDDVVLFKLGQGMEEAGHTKTDADGRFSLKLDNAHTRHLARVVHEGVAYDRVATAGTKSVAIEVYDVVKRVSGIGVVADIMRIQAANGQVTVTRDFGVRNTSNPPRIQLNARNLEFYIPDGAQVIQNSGVAVMENGIPMKSAPVAEGEKNRYSFVFPLRPGLTHFEVSYQLPYSGSAKLDPESLYPLEKFIVVFPKSMQFKAASSTGFTAVQVPNGPDAAVQVASNTREQQNLAFSISGEGALPTPSQGGVQSSNPPRESPAGVAPAARSSNPPARPQGHRWWILGGIVALVIVAGVVVAWRQQAATRAFMRQKNDSSFPSVVLEEDDYSPHEKSSLAAMHGTITALTDSERMGQIKERLFNIEVERKQGKISQAEFEKARTALDEMLDSALKREAQNV